MICKMEVGATGTGQTICTSKTQSAYSEVSIRIPVLGIHRPRRPRSRLRFNAVVGPDAGQWYELVSKLLTPIAWSSGQRDSIEGPRRAASWNRFRANEEAPDATYSSIKRWTPRRPLRLHASGADSFKWRSSRYRKWQQQMTASSWRRHTRTPDVRYVKEKHARPDPSKSRWYARAVASEHCIRAESSKNMEKGRVGKRVSLSRRDYHVDSARAPFCRTRDRNAITLACRKQKRQNCQP
ncbi:hypothetical protein R3P38DRAFT_1449381 [Favolaschia claudopus]|uniref:Uncharacterized protein n=1 Tax=Favolaschia claudopus TaxID=2862362 RepID=A0AAW0AN12_9AGAR